LIEYHDTEWGVPVHDEWALFERLTLEAFQSGLSWLTILKKRPAFREAFAGFDPVAVAAFDARDVERLMNDAGIVRNRAKIEATLVNARATVNLRADLGLPALLWSFQPAASSAPKSLADIPAHTAESRALSRELRRRGFTFVGPTTMMALMQAVGIVDAHLSACPRRGQPAVR
jgi:DNA-3-methyladenine glycosylase I